MSFKKTIIYQNGTTALQKELPGYFIDYYLSSKTLFITFEPAGPPILRPDSAREPWGFNFLFKNGASILGVKPKKVDWYRGADLHSFFRSPELLSILSFHDKVFFYGGSMGGYAAIAFAQVCPGATVISFNPQSTLHPEIVPWEPRFSIGRAQDWDGDFKEAIDGAKVSHKCYVIYDPFHRFDKLHIYRIQCPSLIKLKIPFVGHQMPLWCHQMGFLKDLLTDITEDNFKFSQFQQWAARRRNIARYWTQIAKSRSCIALQRHCVQKALAINSKDTDALSLFCKILLREERYTDAAEIAENSLGVDGFEILASAYIHTENTESLAALMNQIVHSSKQLGPIRLAKFLKVLQDLNLSQDILLSFKNELYRNGAAIASDEILRLSVDADI